MSWMHMDTHMHTHVYSHAAIVLTCYFCYFAFFTPVSEDKQFFSPWNWICKSANFSVNGTQKMFSPKSNIFSFTNVQIPHISGFQHHNWSQQTEYKKMGIYSVITIYFYLPTLVYPHNENTSYRLHWKLCYYNQKDWFGFLLAYAIQ